MLLLVALVATIIGWRTAVEQVQRENRKGERKSLQITISELEKYVDECKQAIEKQDGRWEGADAAMAMKSFENQIAETKKKIENLSK